MNFDDVIEYIQVNGFDIGLHAEDGVTEAYYVLKAYETWFKDQSKLDLQSALIKAVLNYRQLRFSADKERLTFTAIALKAGTPDKNGNIFTAEALEQLAENNECMEYDPDKKQLTYTLEVITDGTKKEDNREVPGLQTGLSYRLADQFPSLDMSD